MSIGEREKFDAARYLFSVQDLNNFTSLINFQKRRRGENEKTKINILHSNETKNINISEEQIFIQSRSWSSQSPGTRSTGHEKSEKVNSLHDS